MWKRLFLIITAALMLFYLTACSGVRAVKLSGTAECTQYDVHAEAAGKIVSVAVREGELVKEGQVIASLDSSLQETSVQQAKALVRAKEAQLASVESGSREEQIAAAEAALTAATAKYDELRKGATAEQIKQAKSAANLAASNENSAKKAYNSLKAKYEEARDGYNKGLVTKQQLDEAKFAMDEAYGKYKAAAHQHDIAYAQYQEVKKGPSGDAVKAAKAGMDQARAQYELVKNGSTQYARDAAEADLEAAQAQLAQANLLRDRCDIKASVTGVLAMLGVEKGSMVNTGGYIATIADTSDLWTHVYIPQGKLQCVSLSQKVLVTSPALPGAEFAGTVVFIASQAEFTPKNTETHESKENTVFKIKIKLHDAEGKLKPGMTLDVTIPIVQAG